jgi:rhodanese-related sulfurtransferase
MTHAIRTAIVAALLFTGVSVSACDHPRAEPGTAHASASSGGVVDGNEARRLLAEENAVLVDVRTPEEFADGHVSEAINIPVQELDARMGELSRERPVVVYCRSGRRSDAAASALRAAGYTAHDLGPMNAWGG